MLEVPRREPNWCHGWFDDIPSHSVFLFHLTTLQLSMGVLGFGFIATYLPEAAISAYLAATALHIILSQLTCIFGIMISFHAGPISFFYVSNFYPHPQLQIPLSLFPKRSRPEWRCFYIDSWVKRSWKEFYLF